MITLNAMQNFITKVPQFFKDYGLKVIEAAFVLLLGWILGWLIKKILKKAFSRTGFDISLEKFIIKMVDICVKVIVIIASISALGVSTTGLVAAFSAAAVAISLALKDSLSNIAGGIMMLLTHPFRTGDYIEADGYSGTVLQIDYIMSVSEAIVGTVCYSEHISVLSYSGSDVALSELDKYFRINLAKRICDIDHKNVNCILK